MSTVTVGCRVTVQDGDADESWRVVSSLESDPSRGSISEDSPMGRALLGHGAGDRVRVYGPAGERTVTVLAVESSGDR